jgi:hypothetical protein
MPWQEQARNPSVDLWLRVTFLAFGTHKRNGHSAFYNWKEIADKTTTQSKAAPDDGGRQIRRAIDTAIERGFLSTQSHTRCLVVPPHWISGGTTGRENAKCNRH